MTSFLALLAACVVFGHAPFAFAEPLTVSDAIQTTRFTASAPAFGILTPSGESLTSGSSEIFISPDHKLWAALLIRGDLEKNGNWAEILVGSLESLDAAARSRVVARFFTHSLSDGAEGGSAKLTQSGSNHRPLQWLVDSRRLALLWADDADKKQIFVVDVPTGKVRQVSKHPTSIHAFTNHGDRFLYFADHSGKESSAATSAQIARRKGVTIETRSLPAVLRGEFDGRFVGPYFKWFILDASTGESREIAGLGLSRFDSTRAIFSDDGGFAIVESSPESIPESWFRYTEPPWNRMIRQARIDRNDAFGRQLIQLYVIDVRQAAAWPLWDAPSKPFSKIAWSPDGHAVAISPTFVPVSAANTAGLAGYAMAVVEPKSGRFHAIPISDRSPLAAASLRWVSPTMIEFHDGNDRYQFWVENGDWRKASLRSRRSGPRVPHSATIDLHVEEDLNTPPTLVATERRGGRRRVIYDPNPQLKERFNLGQVAMIDWRDREGRVWVGRLYYPVNWQAGHRYPLVIQTAGYARPGRTQTFSLYGGEMGPGLGPGVTVHAAQPLANRSIMVLSTERKYLPGIDETPRDAPVHAAAYEAAVDHLDRMGLIDRRRVGISGFSNTGYLVQYALVHSAFHYAAAITDDNVDYGYYQAVTTGKAKEYANVNGAAPYGEGLKLWMQRAPAFNADKIRTPLRLQQTSPPLSILAPWEIFTRLRELNKPVELFLVPDIERGSHGIQNPAQCLASQEGAVDWFDFWLNGHEDTRADKAAQYERWATLRAQRDVSLNK